MEALELETRVAELSAKTDAVILGYKILTLSLLVLFSTVNLDGAYSIAKFQQIYQDTLPGKPLPLLTLGVIRFQTLLMCLVFVWPLLGVTATFTLKKFPTLAIALGALVSVVGVQTVLTWLSLFLPMFALDYTMSDQH